MKTKYKKKKAVTKPVQMKPEIHQKLAEYATKKNEFMQDIAEKAILKEIES
jgi:hypothetical protein